MAAKGTQRHDPAWYTPLTLPAALRAFDQPVQGGLAVGASGKVGLLELTLGPSNGTTHVFRQYQRAPLYMYRPIYLDCGRPDMAFVFVLQSGDGVVQGDRYRIDVRCLPRAAVHLTTQAPSKVFGARQNFATQIVNLTVDEDAVLEYLPDPVLPFAGSRFLQTTRLSWHPDSTVIMGETLLPGRVAYGEAHAFDFYCSATEVSTPGGHLVFADLLRLTPFTGEDPHSVGLLGHHHVVSTLYVLTGRVEPATVVELLRSVARLPGVLRGVSELPNGCGATLRILGPTAQGVGDTLRAAWNAVRPALVGAPPPDLRKG